MIEIAHFLAKLVSVGLEIVFWAMFLRALLPFFVNPEESKLLALLTLITEPFILPVRYVLYKFNLFGDSPFDFAYLITYIILTLLQNTLPAI